MGRTGQGPKWYGVERAGVDYAGGRNGLGLKWTGVEMVWGRNGWGWISIGVQIGGVKLVRVESAKCPIDLYPIVRGSHGFSLFVKSISNRIFSVTSQVRRKRNVLIHRTQPFTLINTLYLFQMCKITEKIEIEIDSTKRENVWDPRTRRSEMARVGARTATIKGSM